MNTKEWPNKPGPSKHYFGRALNRSINVSTELEMMFDARKNGVRQTLQVRVTSDTKKIQSSDWLK